jgi:hypothetical protein
MKSGIVALRMLVVTILIPKGKYNVKPKSY